MSYLSRYLYNKVVNYDVTWEKGGEAVPKDPLDMPTPGANNIGTANPVIDESSWFGEGGYVSRFMNNIRPINAVAGMHLVGL